MWFATLNPGRKGRAKARRGGRRRKLSAWQQMVKKYGGVMQALKHKRGSVVTRRSRRGRSRRSSFGRFVMAKVRSRRRTRRKKNPLWRVRRGYRGSVKTRRGRRVRGGMFFGRRLRRAHRMRRGRKGGWRQNAVLPFSVNPRRRRGRRRGRRGFRRNAVVPVSWNPGLYPNPRRRSRRSRRRYSYNPRRRSRRSYRRNSSAILPFSLNPAGAIRGLTARVGSFTNVSFWIEEAIPAAGGFLGTKTVGAMIHGMISKQLGTTGIADKVLRVASDALAASGLAWIVGEIGSKVVGKKAKKVADRVFFGGVVGIAHSVLRELLGGTDIGRVLGLSGLGDDLADRMKAEVQRRVESEMSGMGAYLTSTDLSLQGLGTYMTSDDLSRQNMGEFVSDTALRAQGGYSALPSGSLAEHDAADETLRL